MLNFDIPNTLPLLLLVIAASIGGLDILYYHMYKFRLYDQPASRGEVVTHILRGIFIGLGSFMLVSYDIRGAWIYLVAGLFILDFINEIADVYLEPKSRAPLGGLPPNEYIIHIIGATMAGAITMAFFILFWQFRNEPSSIESLAAGTLPIWLSIAGYLLAYGALILTAVDVGMFIRSICRTRKVA